MGGGVLAPKKTTKEEQLYFLYKLFAIKSHLQNNMTGGQLFRPIDENTLSRAWEKP
jgi:hypothetical protein